MNIPSENDKPECNEFVHRFIDEAEKCQCSKTAKTNSHSKMLEADELRVFLLAACMVDMFIHINTRSKTGMSGVISRVDTLLKQDMTFTTRFKKAVSALYKSEAKSNVT